MNRDRLAPLGASEEPLLECPECGEIAVTTKPTSHTFTYGHGNEAVQITAELPMRGCRHCGFQYLDQAGQKAQHDAVCRHLGLMTPAQIRALRKYHRLSRAELSDLTGLGEASIARWERGALIQTVANNTLLSLLAFEENIQRLRDWAGGGTRPPKAAPEPGKSPSFPSLSAERITTLRVEQAAFRL